MKIQTIGVLGGTGFVGRHLVMRLANQGYTVQVLTRHRERHKSLFVMPQISLIEADIQQDEPLRTHLAGCDAVINLVGILNGTESAFYRLHAELPQRLARLCTTLAINRFIQMSALNADPNGPSIYLRTKGKGEQAALSAVGVKVSLLRPSVIFGPDDSFFNRFAGILRFNPIVPLACPDARLSPVYIEDVVSAILAILDDAQWAGQALELCGPKVYTLKELVQYTATLMKCKRWIIGLPDSLSRLQAQVFERLPGQLFTMDNYYSLQCASVCKTDGFKLLNITPQSVEAVMPHCFYQPSTPRRRYQELRKIARRDQ